MSKLSLPLLDDLMQVLNESYSQTKESIKESDSEKLADMKIMIFF